MVWQSGSKNENALAKILNRDLWFASQVGWPQYQEIQYFLDEICNVLSNCTEMELEINARIKFICQVRLQN